MSHPNELVCILQPDDTDSRVFPLELRGKTFHTRSGNDFQIVHVPLFVEFVSPLNVEMKQQDACLHPNEEQIEAGRRLLEALLALRYYVEYTKLCSVNHRRGL